MVGTAALENSWTTSQKLNIELLYDLAIPLLVTYLRELKTYVHTKACTGMFTAVLFILAQKWNSQNVHQLVNR